ncbi:hypothetical protein BV20DRAFT_969002 [Pilatotrama ljubarskyi]|nr:hypothetical protein BV20DRAFT_969002 [Pilatotrama ljubarskyi]
MMLSFQVRLTEPAYAFAHALRKAQPVTKATLCRQLQSRYTGHHHLAVRRYSAALSSGRLTDSLVGSKLRHYDAPYRSASRKATEQQRDAAPKLPELPLAPPYPTPFLADEEIATYLIPLYARHWTVQPSDPGPKNKPAPELVKVFTFKQPDCAREFLQDVQDVEKSENHEALAILEERPLGLSSLVVKVHTHSGLRPASHPEEPRRARVQPGITLRDVRFAYLLEERYSARTTGPRDAEIARADYPAYVSGGRPHTAQELEAWRHSSRRTQP